MIFFVCLVFTSSLLSWLIVGLIKNYLAQQLLDIPNQRSSHTQPTPRGGGLGFIVAFGVTSVLATWVGLPSHWERWLVLLPLIIVGILDDYQGVSSKVRYLVQLITALGAIALWGFVSIPGGPVAGIVITIIAITAMINFYNFMDGLDGLVASCSLTQLALLAIYLQQPELWLLVAALVGFLWWNWSPAKIFMGDTGSTFLGAIVALVILSAREQPFYLWTAFAMTLPLISDAIYTLLRRLLKKENIFQAHRTHIYQRLQQAGWSHSNVATSYALLTLLMGVMIIFWGLEGVILGVVAIIVGLITSEYYLQSRITDKDQIRLN